MASESLETYQSWNRALAQYFLQGVARGSRIYLSVDDIALEMIGQQQFETEPTNGSWREDLIAAVRGKVVTRDGYYLANERCIKNGERHSNDYLCLDLIRFRDREFNIPNGVAFLAVCVLAAHDMQNDEKAHSTAYFKRLRNILQLPGNGRPAEMKRTSKSYVGSDFEYLDETLWCEWNCWLKDQGFTPTARSGSERSQKYINYPISQCLLRQADCDELLDYFAQNNLQAPLDSQILFNKLRFDCQQFKEHLKRLIKDIERRDILMDLVQELHQQWIDEGCLVTKAQSKATTQKFSSTLSAGLFRREEDYEIEYYPYPKQKPRQKLASIIVQYTTEDGALGQHQLDEERPGWYEYLDMQLASSDLCSDKKYKVVSPNVLKSIQLLARDFWALIPDPDNPNTGTYASWLSSNCNESFILLCRKTLLSDLRFLRGLGIVDWSDKFSPFEEEEISWFELHEFSILDSQWSEPNINNSALVEFLQNQPTTQASISLSGGLRAPNQKAWLEGYAPSIKILANEKRYEFEIFELPHEKPIDSFEGLESGDYIVRLKNAKKEKERALKIIKWSELEIRKINPEYRLTVELPKTFVCGALLIDDDNQASGEKRKVDAQKPDLKSWCIGFKYFGRPEHLIDSICDAVNEHNLNQSVKSIQTFQKTLSKKSVREFSFFITINSDAVGEIPDQVQSKIFSLPFFSQEINVPSWGKTVSQNKRVVANIVGSHNIYPYPIPIKSKESFFENLESSPLILHPVSGNFIQLLDWLSAKGHSSKATFKEICQSLEIKHPDQISRKLKLLGYLETSSDGKKWAIAPTALVPLNPDSENLEFYLCGQQNVRLRQELGAVAELEQEGQPVPFGLPRWKVTFSDRATYNQLETLCGIPIHKPGNIAQHLAECLPTLKEWQASLPAVGGIVSSQHHWRRYQPESQYGQAYGLPDKTGLYEMCREVDQKYPDRTLFYEAATQTWRQADWYGLRFLALHHSDKLQECCYRPAQKQLAILASDHWPQLYERALVLASGYLPQKSSDDRWLCYHNITPELAYSLTEILSLTCRGL